MTEKAITDWRPIGTAHELDRVLVAGWQPPTRSVAGYWWIHEDMIINGKPDEHPDALLWHPFPAPPTVDPRSIALAATDLRAGFAECFRVLRPHGTLIFKWNEHEVRVSEILALTDQKPLFGNRCGKNAKSHWIVFMKPEPTP